MQLSQKNEWIILAKRIPWKLFEKDYAMAFPSKKGHPAAPLRQALGSLIIQKRMKLSDRALIKAISENPYFQYFIGLEKFTSECPFVASTLVSFRKRLNAEFLQKVNENFLASASCTREHTKKKTKSTPAGANSGTFILDATCSPSNIRYPQDFSLLNEAREKTDAMIDRLHATTTEKKRPRTYRRKLRSSYLSMAKSKKRNGKDMRSLIRKLLCALERNMRIINQYLNNGCTLSSKELNTLNIIMKLYAQQKEMFDNRCHRVDNRIVSISQPYIRPIVRGKVKTPVEFGAKYDVSIDEKGHARLEKISFDPYNECTMFIDSIERYKNRTGHYPERALVDQIYNTQENRNFCQERGIRISTRKPGRPTKEKNHIKQQKRDQKDRIEVERFFSLDKRCFGAGLIVTKLSETTLASIALSVFVANLFETSAGLFFVFYLMDAGSLPEGVYFCEFLDGTPEEAEVA